MVLINLCVKTVKPLFEGDKNITAVEGNILVYQVYHVSRAIVEGRVEGLKVGMWVCGWIPTFLGRRICHYQIGTYYTRGAMSRYGAG